MKELEKTKRISLAAVLSILLIAIGLLNYRKPSYLYSQNTKTTLSKLDTTDYLVSPQGLETGDYVLVDVRNPFEFGKGHLPDAINIYAPELLGSENNTLLMEKTSNGKPILLYGNNPNETLPVFMMLCQLDMGPVKILEGQNYFEKDQLKTVYYEVEKTTPDIQSFIQESVKKASEQKKVQPKKQVDPKPKTVVPAKKKKKKMPEGGC
jgi:rhodanese-related sulfurtransferase